MIVFLLEFVVLRAGEMFFRSGKFIVSTSVKDSSGKPAAERGLVTDSLTPLFRGDTPKIKQIKKPQT
jgi:hypothetical protein